MIKLAFVFSHAPHGNSSSREGLDALLAATAFCAEDEIAVFFLDEGVLNLLPYQQPELILQKDFIPAFKLLDLYEIEQRYLCQQSWQQFHLNEVTPLLKAKSVTRHEIMQKLSQAQKILNF